MVSSSAGCRQGTSAENADARQRFSNRDWHGRELPGVTAVAVSNIPIETGLNLAMTPPPGALIEQMRAVDWRCTLPTISRSSRSTLAPGRRSPTTIVQAARCRVVNEVSRAPISATWMRPDTRSPSATRDPARSSASSPTKWPIGCRQVQFTLGAWRGQRASVYVPVAQALTPRSDREPVLRHKVDCASQRFECGHVEPGMREGGDLDLTLAFIRSRA